MSELVIKMPPRVIRNYADSAFEIYESGCKRKSFQRPSNVHNIDITLYL